MATRLFCRSAILRSNGPAIPRNEKSVAQSIRFATLLTDFGSGAKITFTSSAVRTNQDTVYTNQSSSGGNREDRRHHRGRRRHNNNGEDNGNGARFSATAFDKKPAGDPNLFRAFFRSPDKIRSLEDAQVFISHMKTNYGPLIQYQFARCPETKKYFGYGFLTFRNKESYRKAIDDKFIRVSAKDYEIQVTGYTPPKRQIRFGNPGFQGFHDIEELRAAKAVELKEAATKSMSQTESSSVETLQSSSSDSGSSQEVEPADFVSAFKSQSPGSLGGIEAGTVEVNADKDDGQSALPSTTQPTSSMRSNEKKLVQLWKTIPEGIERAERNALKAKETGDEKEDDQEILSAQKTAGQ
ncbi:hypothetical protein BGW38_004988 [Lunasporangiospora selenospora]|uniref:RRM domain-containing protein n=1 Tax=Lunasporangiospora selenospora TaxID=979761 RepID=A0A9P6FZU3_9FUNG|nr:hypothetical protein BGW38_004988 [Lunasporangiospora selenospora]